ncbi:hypothetical protein BJ508DRAFT_310587 [Ascobolus immersus RN42]|uniref:Uncharacterized protein n=1 Tax=Ascobolus immersus RN42 TaxID=1160509 RepID=A0A3N4HUL1_ASCIM|nr:hypothetical protein BJ508DRAFT_310587 [Ascobolus immersus RN42]
MAPMQRLFIFLICSLSLSLATSRLLLARDLNNDHIHDILPSPAVGHIDDLEIGQQPNYGSQTWTPVIPNNNQPELAKRENAVNSTEENITNIDTTTSPYTPLLPALLHCYTTSRLLNHVHPLKLSSPYAVPPPQGPFAEQIRLYGSTSVFPVALTPQNCTFQVAPTDHELVRRVMSRLEDPVLDWCERFVEDRPLFDLGQQLVGDTGYGDRTGRVLAEFLKECPVPDTDQGVNSSTSEVRMRMSEDFEPALGELFDEDETFHAYKVVRVRTEGVTHVLFVTAEGDGYYSFYQDTYSKIHQVKNGMVQVPKMKGRIAVVGMSDGTLKDDTIRTKVRVVEFGAKPGAHKAWFTYVGAAWGVVLGLLLLGMCIPKKPEPPVSEEPITAYAYYQENGYYPKPVPEELRPRPSRSPFEAVVFWLKTIVAFAWYGLEWYLFVTVSFRLENGPWHWVNTEEDKKYFLYAILLWTAIGFWAINWMWGLLGQGECEQRRGFKTVGFFVTIVHLGIFLMFLTEGILQWHTRKG